MTTKQPKDSQMGLSEQTKFIQTTVAVVVLAITIIGSVWGLFNQMVDPARLLP